MSKGFFQQSTERVVHFLGSKKALYIILAIFFLQSLWVALSFRFPMAFDESYHFPIIQIFSDKYTPVVTEQPTQHDYLRDLRYEQSFLYHYLASFPYRLVNAFTDSIYAKVVSLRVISVAMFITGLYLFTRIFQRLKIKQLYINIALVIFTMIPLVPLVAANISYDNLLFPLAALFFLACIDVLQARKPSLCKLLLVLMIGALASLAKNIFLPLYAFGVVFVIALLFKDHGRNTPRLLWQSLREIPKRNQYLLFAGLVIVATLFSAVYLRNIAMFGTPRPSCLETLSESRCRANALIVRGRTALATKDERQPESILTFSRNWAGRMINYSTYSLNSTHPSGRQIKKPLPIIKKVLIFGAGIGLLLLLYKLRHRYSRGEYYLLAISFVMIFGLFIQNAAGYYRFHAAFANQPRYLLPILLPLIVFIIVAMNRLLSKVAIRLKVVVLFIFAVLLLQGGGVITHIVRSEPSWYWQHPIIIETNENIQSAVKPLVWE